ncbi:hypothetical protein JB92DRAFT_2904540 [Gautieria morchelliformis]|nr:hypothetical protein JB92DRAFT_2904540 [Gautieria morchelliformis]
MSRSTKARLAPRSASFYAVLLFVVGPVYAAAPLAWAFVLHALWKGTLRTYTLFGKAAFLWAVLEVIFSIFHYTLARRVSATPPLPPADLPLLQTAFSRVLKAGLANLPSHTVKPSRNGDTSHDEEQDAKERGSVHRLGSPSESITQLDFHDPRAQDFREYMRTWFHRKPWSEIRTHEMRQWIYWSTFNAHLPPDSELSPVHRAALDEGMAMIQRRAGAHIKHGSNPQCKPLLLTLDPVTIHLRPLIFYTSVWLANQWIKGSLQREWGLEFGKYGDLEYLVRLPQHTGPPTSRPLVFIHGLGLGLLQYNLPLQDFLRSLPSRPILIPLQPHISQNIFHPRFLNPLPREESVRCLTEIIGKMGWGDQGVDMLSHSNGSIFHAWMLKSCPEIIRRSCFVDPVTFCSWEGDVCYNFVYRPCTTSIELMMRYFVGSEVGVANVIQRHFDWFANSLWYEEIPHASDPRKTVFYLGGEDDIVESERVQRYLRSHGVHKGLWFDPKGRHGQGLIAGGKGLQRVITWLLEGV